MEQNEIQEIVIELGTHHKVVLMTMYSYLCTRTAKKWGKRGVSKRRTF